MCVTCSRVSVARCQRRSEVKRCLSLFPGGAAQQAVARDRAIIRENRGSTRFEIDCTATARARTRPAREPRAVSADAPRCSAPALTERRTGVRGPACGSLRVACG
jgi:hypothetical protein